MNLNAGRFFQFGAGGLLSNPKVKMIAGVIRPDGNSAGSGTITWTFLDPVTNHSKITSVPLKIEASGSDVRLRYPRCRNVIYAVANTDETLAANGITCGASVGQETMDIKFFQSYGIQGGYLTGGASAGASWTKTGDLISFTFGTLNAGTIYFRPIKPFANSGTDAQNGTYWNASMATYVGSNVRTLRRVVAGLGSDYFGYQLYDSLGVLVTTNDSNDRVEIMVNTPKRVQINANSNNSTGYPGANVFTTTSNIWVHALLEY
jgi:hypothetical protein